MQHRSLSALFDYQTGRLGDQTAFRFKQRDRWVDMSWNEGRERSRQVAKGLIACGLEPGDKVCILSPSRLEWVLSDLGIAAAAGVTVGIYPTLLGPDCAYIIHHADAAILFVEDRRQLQKISEVRGDLPQLRQIVLFEGADDPSGQATSWESFLERGREIPDSTVDERIEKIDPDDLLSLVYTSGTTGVPKGVMLSHRNLLSAAESAAGMLEGEPGYVTLLFLPLAHVFARMNAYMALRRGMVIAFAENLAAVPANLREIRPHFIASVPRLYEKIQERVLAMGEAATGLRRALFRWSVEIGRQVSRLKQQRQAIPTWLRLRHRLADRLVLRRVREAVGGRLRYGISGAAPLNPSVAEFFDGCGVAILEGIGMTENGSFTNVNRIQDNKFGTVGRTGPGIEMRIADDGEVLFRGDNVMLGYYKDPQATAEALDSEGWLHTGDIGEIDEEGYLRITDRKKDLIITAGGKNVAPQRIERILRTSRFISHVMAYGDRRKFLSALVTLDSAAIREWAVQKGLDTTDELELVRHPLVQELIEKEIDERNGELASFESIKKFHIVPGDFSIEGGELTPTLKLKRKVVVERYQGELDRLYA